MKCARGACFFLTAGLAGLTVAAGLASAQTWQPLKNQPYFGDVGAILLLTDGTVLAHVEPLQAQKWYKMTPDIHGS